MLRRALAIMALLSLAAFLSGCFSFTQTNSPVVESQYGLVTVQPESSVPEELPVLSAEVSPAPVLDTYEECYEFLQQINVFEQLNNLCAAQWSMSEDPLSGIDHISMTLMAGSNPARFRVFFLAYRPNEMYEEMAMSKEYLAPPNWAGFLSFDVPLGTYKRVLLAYIQFTNGGQVPLVLFFPPCPEDFLWPESYTYDDCLEEFH